MIDPIVKERFIQAFNQIAMEIHMNACAKGFWDEERNDGEMIADVIIRIMDTAYQRGYCLGYFGVKHVHGGKAF